MLDAFDIEILSLLQKQGDLTNVQLSEKVHLSSTQCARRVAKLKLDGYIAKFAAILCPKMLGLNITAHTYISLRVHEEAENAKFRNFVKLRAEITECYAQTGDADYFLKVRVRDLDALSLLLNEMIKVSGGFAVLRSSVVLEEIKVTTAVSLKDAHGFR